MPMVPPDSCGGCMWKDKIQATMYFQSFVPQTQQATGTHFVAINRFVF